jgi:hypothetical protein
MTAIGPVTLTSATSWAARSPLESPSQRNENVRLEHRLDGPRAASIEQRAAEQREIYANAPAAPSWREPGRTPIVADSIAPMSPAPDLRGPRMSASRETPRARGGGPAPSVQQFANDEVGVSRGLRVAGASTVSAPLGCSRIEAVAAPAVRSVALTVTNEAGRSVASAQHRGRLAVVSFCPRDEGHYFVTARAVGGRVADPVQLFVE